MSRGSQTVERKHGFNKVRLYLECLFLGFFPFPCVLFHFLLFLFNAGKWDKSEQNRLEKNCVAETEEMFISLKSYLILVNYVKMLGFHQ